jgi:multidrug resistance efflux pump
MWLLSIPLELSFFSLQAQRKRSRDALEDTRVRAPFAGYIAQTFVENFQDVRAEDLREGRLLW